MKHNSYNKCICGNLKDTRSKSCSLCYRKTLKGKTHPNYGKKHLGLNQGKNNPNWIEDRRSLKKYCIDCKKEIIGHSNPKRCNSCAKIGIQNPAYIHGKGNNPYPLEFNQQLKEAIRKRDNYQCQNCGMTQEEQFIVYGRDLEVHHIDYNKNNCKENNLISLCQGCNIRANFNRDYWIKIFENKILEKINE